MSTYNIEYYLDRCDPEAIRFTNLDGAIIGTCHNGNLVYDFDLMHDLLVAEGMESDEAVEWIDFNVVGTMAGNGFTIVYQN